MLKHYHSFLWRIFLNAEHSNILHRECRVSSQVSYFNKKRREREHWIVLFDPYAAQLPNCFVESQQNIIWSLALLNKSYNLICYTQASTIEIPNNLPTLSLFLAHLFLTTKQPIFILLLYVLFLYLCFHILISNAVLLLVKKNYILIALWLDLFQTTIWY